MASSTNTWSAMGKNIKARVDRLLREQGIDDSPPIDVERLANSLGIHVVERADLSIQGTEVSGLLLRANGRSICVVNSDHHRNRQRFTIAHEIGHWHLHPVKGEYVDFAVHRRDPQSSEGTNREEIEANAFAAELLMPEALVRRELPYPLNVAEDEETIRRVARRFRVSPQAMTHRLTNLDLVW